MTGRRGLLEREPPPWLNALLIFGTLAAVVYWEIRRPLRRTRQSKVTRDGRNLVMSLATAATVALAEKPVTAHLCRAVQERRFGLLKVRPLPAWCEILLSVALLDYTLYIWHYLTHRVPLLWRFHLAHHVDLDLDASSALRFHAGEMLLSVPWRGAQVALLGISPFSLALWQTLTLMEIIFHHSNVRLPHAVERRLCRLVVTPRMHGVHHSAVREETDSNWSTIFSWPDYLHGTVRLNVPHDAIVIGVAGYQDAQELTLTKVMRLPFAPPRPSWPPAAQSRPAPLSLPRTTLAPDQEP